MQLFRIRNVLLCIMPMFFIILYSVFIFFMKEDYTASTLNLMICIVLLLVPPLYWTVVNYANIDHTLKSYLLTYIFLLSLLIIYLFLFYASGSIARHGLIQLPTGKSIGIALFIIRAQFIYLTLCWFIACMIKYNKS